MKPRRSTLLTRGQLASSALRRGAEQIVERDPGVCLDRDPEELHQFRVGVRRMRSDLRTFAKVLDRQWAEALGAELRWLNGDAGPARDVDVLLARLRGRLSELPGPDARPAGGVVDRLVQEREARRRTLVATLGGARYQVLRATLARVADAPELALGPPERAGAPAAAAPMMRRPWRRLTRAASALGEVPSDTALHELRILARRCRYAAEAAVPVAGRPAKRFARAITGVQDVLGAHHDAVVAEDWLRATAISAVESALPAGELILLEHQEQQRLRAAWPAAWASASDPKLRAWFAAARG